ncbi:unnamed protein product [Blepharisma stoltei]|uniref:Phospholipid/glycerol acyltransferase domain-containing protein n=1 Tax=Blepharisma stoltei TaxID=1481888 RepID=A0AAU9K1M4_9CILI|nr:unnamed protein product [Blepharisma stoltei]
MWICLISICVFVISPIMIIELCLYKLRPLIKYTRNLPNSGVDIFRRWDIPKWNRLKFYLGAIIFLYLRLLLLFTCVFMHWVSAKIVMYKFPIESQPLTSKRRAFFKLSSRFWSRTLLLALGYWKITNHGQAIDKVCVLVSNHTSFIDILYFLCDEDVPSLVSKNGVKGFPFIGTIATAMQCLFIDRFEGREEALKLIEKREIEIAKKVGYPKLVLFPEGTTTNGTGLLYFKRGPFIAKLPVQPIVLRYPEGNFSAAIDVIPIWISAILLICQIRNQLIVNRLPVALPREDITIKEFAESVRATMADFMKVPMVSTTIEEKNELISKIFGYKIKDKSV